MGHYGKFLINYIITGHTASSQDTLRHHRIHYIITGYTASSLDTLHHHRIHCIITRYTASSLDTLHHHSIHCIITGHTASSQDTLRHHWILFSAAVAAFDIAVDGSLARMVRASLFSATPSVIVLGNLTNWQELNVNITYRKMT